MLYYMHGLVSLAIDMSLCHMVGLLCHQVPNQWIYHCWAFDHCYCSLKYQLLNWFSLIISSERKLFSLLLLPVTIGLVITLGFVVSSALCWHYVSASCLLLVLISDVPPSVWTTFVHQHPAYCLHSSQASHLLFELFFHTNKFLCLLSALSCNANCLLIFNHLLLAHPEFLYLACLTMPTKNLHIFCFSWCINVK